ncbi:AAA family ATPase [Pseudomonas fluorescens]|uniref:AAA family ATPase n=1 Tax=Pseudomonas fluorescens TaxID=294 RepID=UPI003F9B1E31
MSVPEVLRDDEARAAMEELSRHYRLHPAERSRIRPPLNQKIWNSESVRKSLSDLFISKCAFCETRVNLHREADVLHFRPIGNAMGLHSRKLEEKSSDHYSWFAYEWENLFLSCTQCNRSKRNIFPLVGPRAQLRCTWTEANASEETLLINPCRTEPRKHLRFSIDGLVFSFDEVGKTTIEVFSLNRPDLVEGRSRKFQACLNAIEAGRSNPRGFDEFRKQLDNHSEFSGAARILILELLSDVASTMGVKKPLFGTIVEDAVRISMAADDEQWGTLLNPVPLSPRHDVLVRDAQLMAPRYIEETRTSQLRHVSIRNFKGVTRLDLDISPGGGDDSGAPCTMLLGENSTGKSTTLQAIALALMGQKMRSKMGIEAEDFLPRELTGWQIDNLVTPEVILEFDTGHPVKLQIDPLTKQFIGDEHPTLILFAFGSRRFFGKDAIRRQHASSLKSLFDPFAKLQHPGRWLQNLDSEDFDAVARAMREVLILQEEDRIGRDEDGRLFVRAHGRDSPLERLSDGYRSLMAMVLNVMRGMIEKWGDLENARGIVLIDEIETHLHPRWKLRVVSALRRAMPNVQFVATTHDPLCLRGMRGGEVHVLVRDDNQQVQALTGLPDVRGLRAEQLLTSDYFGLSSTADPELEGALQRLALPPHARAATDSVDQDALRSLRWIGDTPGEQIVNEALRRFIDEASSTSNIDRSQVREAAVNEVLDRLRSLKARRQI